MASNVGEQLGFCDWVGVAFMGGACELAHIKCRTGIANDIHKHVHNLVTVLSDPKLGPMLIRRLRRFSFHQIILANAQARCRDIEKHGPKATTGEAMLDWAFQYFVASWMVRSGQAGTDSEFKGNISIRWEAGGGDSVVRFRSAVESLSEWRRVLDRWTFTCMDAFEFLEKCKDREGHAIYCDPPFFGPGDKYKHKFTEKQHRDLAGLLTTYANATVVCRFYDAPIVRELYSAKSWAWNVLVGRKQTNEVAPEVLLVRNGRRSLDKADVASA